MMAESEVYTTSQWIKFFCSAGLPPNVAANYAIIFSDNRIQRNMLMDLSKEYLYDMGIKVMGDVIAILRYAKEFHNQLVKEKIIGSNESRASSINKSSPATRMLGHYTRSTASNAKTYYGGNVLQKVEPSVSRKRISMQPQPSTSEVKPAKKTRRVLPEEEGGYTIKMPAGTTEKTRKIMEQRQQHGVATSKKSVFDRLGDSDVSSSTDVKKIIGSGSVFNRLGPSSSEVSTSTSIQSKDPPLAYRGILKNAAAAKKVVSLKTSVSGETSELRKLSPFLKKVGVKPATQSKRTVINNMSNTGVKQINNILRQSAIVSVSGSLGTKRESLTSRLVLNEPVRVSKFNSIKTLEALSSRNEGRLASMRVRPVRGSVFQRLGK